MYGQYRHTLDAKGRIFVPSKLREELGPSFYVSKSPFGPYLTIYPEAEWQAVLKKVSQMPSTKTGQLRSFFGNVVQCEPDKQGRFLLPDPFRKHAGITQEVVFVGIASRAEIWEPERYEAEEKEAYSHPEGLAKLMLENDL